MSLLQAFEQSIAAASHLDDRDLGAIEAARMLARKADAWDVIVTWAEEDADERGGRPAVPQNDNVTMSAFLKACDALGLTPMSRKTIEAARFAKTTGGDDDDSNTPAAPAQVTSAEEFRARAAGRRSP